MYPLMFKYPVKYGMSISRSLSIARTHLEHLSYSLAVWAKKMFYLDLLKARFPLLQRYVNLAIITL